MGLLLLLLIVAVVLLVLGFVIKWLFIAALVVAAVMYLTRRGSVTRGFGL